jgi:hypothetical protein
LASVDIFHSGERRILDYQTLIHKVDCGASLGLRGAGSERSVCRQAWSGSPCRVAGLADFRDNHGFP